MSTPAGVARAHIYMMQLPHRAAPVRGSFQDLVAQEMYFRERRASVAQNVYQGQLLAAGLNVPRAIFDVWTSLLIDEITHENYRPSVVAEKRHMLAVFGSQRKIDTRLVDRAASYAIQSTEALKPYTKAQLEKIKAKMRAAALKNATREEVTK